MQWRGTRRSSEARSRPSPTSRRGAGTARRDATILGELSNSSTIATLNTVISATGPSSPYVDPALPLYMAAVGLKANAYEFRRKIEPGQGASNNAVIIALLEDAIAHVRSNIDRRRAAVLHERLRHIVDCYRGDTRTHGFPPWLTRTYLTYYDVRTSWFGWSGAESS